MNEKEYKKHVRLYRSYCIHYSNEALYEAALSTSKILADKSICNTNPHAEKMVHAHRDAVISILDERYDNIN